MRGARQNVALCVRFIASLPRHKKGLENERLNEHMRAFYVNMCVCARAVQIQLKAQISSQANGFSRSSHDLSISWQQQRRRRLFFM